MSLLANILWLVTSFYVPLLYLLGGIILFPLLPFLYPVIVYSFLPFEREIVSVSYLRNFKEKRELEISMFDKVSPVIRFLANVVWVITFGWVIAIAHIMAGIINICLIWTIITIPNIIAHFKMVPVAFFPFGKKVISKDLAAKLKEEDIQRQFDKLRW